MDSTLNARAVNLIEALAAFDDKITDEQADAWEKIQDLAEQLAERVL